MPAKRPEALGSKLSDAASTEASLTELHPV
jgi:hypothetical protein